MMKVRSSILFCLILLLLIPVLPVLSQETRSTPPEELHSPLFLYGVGLTEAMLSNNVLWGFNRYIAQSDYGMISWDSVKTNLTNPWVWDQDEFAVNHLGHPYQGSIYYTAGRSSGNGFWSSASITLMGSLTWELLMETETPSYNDLIVTTIGGVSFGEILFRLSDVTLHGEDGTIGNPGALRWIGATVMSPTTSINHWILPGRPAVIAPVSGITFAGAGYSQFNVDYLPREDGLYTESGFQADYSLQLEYGDPFTHGNRLPYDYFSLSTGAGLSLNSELIMTLFTEGLLWGKPFWGEKSRQLLGLFLHYDFLYNRIINLGSNAMGLGWLFESPMGKNWKFRSGLHAGFIFMGASDLIFLKYQDLYEDPPDYERRNYSLSIGANSKLDLQFSRKDRLFLDLRYRVYNLYIIDSSVPDEGSSGKDLVGAVSVSARHMIGDRWFAGVQGAFYHKESYYDNYYDLDELLWKYTLFTGVTF